MRSKKETLKSIQGVIEEARERTGKEFTEGIYDGTYRGFRILLIGLRVGDDTYVYQSQVRLNDGRILTMSGGEDESIGTTVPEALSYAIHLIDSIYEVTVTEEGTE